MRPYYPPAEGERVDCHVKIRFCLDQTFGHPVNRLLNVGYFADDCVLFRELGALEDLCSTTLDFLFLLT